MNQQKNTNGRGAMMNGVLAGMFLISGCVVAVFAAAAALTLYEVSGNTEELAHSLASEALEKDLNLAHEYFYDFQKRASSILAGFSSRVGVITSIQKGDYS